MTNPSNQRAHIEYTQYLHLSASLLVTVARWWCDAPMAHQEELAKLASNMRPETGLNQMTPGNRKMLRQFNNREMALRVLMTPHDIVEPFLHRAGFSTTELRRLQRATMAEVQIATALRPKNLAALILGINVFERGGKLYIHLPSVEVKNKVELEFELSDHCAKILRFYISTVRPLLCKCDSRYLWPSKNGRSLTATHIGTALGDFMEAEVGVRVTGHRFRHVVGYIYLLDNPNGYEVVRLLLGHKSIKTTMQYYASLEVKEGHKRYDDFIERRRRELPNKNRGA